MILTEYKHCIQPKLESIEGPMDEKLSEFQFDDRDDASFGFPGEIMDNTSHCSSETLAWEGKPRTLRARANDDTEFELDYGDQEDPLCRWAERMFYTDCISAGFRSESPPLQLQVQPKSRMIVGSPGAAISSETQRQQYDSTSISIASSAHSSLSQNHEDRSVMKNDTSSTSSPESKATPHGEPIFSSSSPTIAAAPVKEGKTLENKQFREQFMLELSEMARTKWLEEDIHGISSSMSSKLHSSSESSFQGASSTSSHQTNSVSSASSDVQESSFLMPIQKQLHLQ
jgi:hypothetical protein